MGRPNSPAQGPASNRQSPRRTNTGLDGSSEDAKKTGGFVQERLERIRSSEPLIAAHIHAPRATRAHAHFARAANELHIPHQLHH